MKIYWEVSPAPTGRYKSFERRSWPMGYGDKEKTHVMFYLTCEEEYVPKLVKAGKHGEIRIHIAVYKDKFVGFEWKRLVKAAATLDEAKEIAKKFAEKFPEVFKNKEL